MMKEVRVGSCTGKLGNGFQIKAQYVFLQVVLGDFQGILLSLTAIPSPPFPAPKVFCVPLLGSLAMWAHCSPISGGQESGSYCYF